MKAQNCCHVQTHQKQACDPLWAVSTALETTYIKGTTEYSELLGLQASCLFLSLCVSALKGKFDLSALSARRGWSRCDCVRPHQDRLRIAENHLTPWLGLVWNGLFHALSAVIKLYQANVMSETRPSLLLKVQYSLQTQVRPAEPKLWEGVYTFFFFSALNISRYMSVSLVCSWQPVSPPSLPLPSSH